jgi:hypothetical protein
MSIKAKKKGKGVKSKIKQAFMQRVHWPCFSHGPGHWASDLVGLL